MKLTNTQIKNASSKDKSYKLTDGKGLFLLVHPNGSKYWRMKYHLLGKEKLYSIGVYPSISLAQAREACFEAKKLITQGIDPTHTKHQNKISNEISANTFQSIAEEWIKIKSKTWSEGYTKKLIQSFKKNIYPFIGNVPIHQIKSLDLLKTFQIMEDRGAASSAAKIRGQCGEVFTHALITGRCDNNPCSGLYKAMMNPPKQHFAFLLEKDLPPFLSTLTKNTEHYRMVGQATRLLMITGVRTTELRNAEWTEIDFKKALWEIPAEKMKQRKPHIVPLSTQAIEILKQIYEYTGSYRLVFIGRNNPDKPMSDGTILRSLDRMGYRNKVTGHGFRHTMSTILHEHNFNSAHIELQLAHVDKNSVRGTYNHAQHLEERRKMLQWYADYLDELERKTEL